MSMSLRIRPFLVSGLPSLSQNSMRLPVPVCTLTMMSPITRRSRTSSTPSQGGAQMPFGATGSVPFQSSLQRWLCQMTFHSSSRRS